MPELDLRTIPAQPPPLAEDGEPIPCPRCGGLFERPLEGGIMGHQVGDPRSCQPMKGQAPRDYRDRKRNRGGKA